ncbi:MAG: DUF115 domain-containing protein [Methanobacteriota archaeon]|nr:MAG: DUF115 domain-containing protein [Euryarchaeota archaeon]
MHHCEGRRSGRQLHLGREGIKLDRWLPLYHEICLDFGFSEAEDERSARLLSSMIAGRSTRTLDEMYASTVPRKAVVCGGGDTLVSDISSIAEGDYIVAADGATSALLDKGLLPDVIVTDLDGNIEDQVDANTRGSTVFVHAHGDNIAALERWVGEFTGKVIGTCQGNPVEGIFNFGGFTDGDRAACVMAELGAREIRLAGFELAHPSEKPGRSMEIKAMKLAWAERILEMLRKDGVEFSAVSQG